MLILLSPAKKQLFNRSHFSSHSPVIFPDKTQLLMNELQKWSEEKIASTMKISAPLALKTFEEYQKWEANSVLAPAITVYNGPAFTTLDPFSFSENERATCAEQVIILSGLYGLLHANTRIAPYRLEMGISAKFGEQESLYSFWKSTITQYLRDYVQKYKMPAIVNCASGEYSKAIDFEQFDIPVITCDFREMKNGVPKSVSSFAKQARGLMARWLIQSGCSDCNEIKKFSLNGYSFSEDFSTETLFCFTR